MRLFKNITLQLLLFFFCFSCHFHCAGQKKYATDSLYKIAIKQNNDSLLNAVLKSHIKSHYRKENWERFHKYRKEHLLLTLKIKDTLSHARTLEYTASFFRKNDKIDSAYFYYSKALKLYSQFEDSLNTGFTQLNLAIIQKNLRNYSGSIYKLNEALKLIKNKANTRRISSIYNTLANNYGHMKMYDSSLTYHTRALDLRKTIKNPIYQVKSFNNIGEVYKDQKLYKKALNYFNKTNKHDELLKKYPSIKAKLLDNATHSLFLLNNNAKHIEQNFLKALSLRDSINDSYGKVMSYIHLAEFYQFKKKKKLATHYIHLAEKIAKELNNHQDYISALELQILLFEGKAKQKALNTYSHIRDSLDFADEKKLIKLYDTENLLNQKNNLLSKSREQNRKKHIVNVILVSSLIILLLLMMMIIRRKRAKEKELQKLIASIKDVQNEVFCTSNFSLNERNKDLFFKYLKNKLNIRDSQIKFWEYQSQGLSESDIAKAIVPEVTIYAIKGRRKKLYKILKSHYNLDKTDKVTSIEIYRRELKKFMDSLQKNKH